MGFCRRNTGKSWRWSCAGGLEKNGAEISPTSQRPNVVTLGHPDIEGKSQQTLSLGEAKRNMSIQILGVRNSFVELGFEELELGTKERRFKTDLSEGDLKNPRNRHSLNH